MGCEQCKLLDASESESHDNVIANVTAAEQSADPCETAIKEDATNTAQLTSPLNQFSNLAASENGVVGMDQDLPNTEPPPEDSTSAPIRSLIELCDIDSNILDSTERLEVHDEVGDLSQSPNSAAMEEPVSSSGGTAEEVTTTEHDNRRSATEEDESGVEGAADAPVRRRRGTVRVNSIRGHKVCKVPYYSQQLNLVNTT